MTESAAALLVDGKVVAAAEEERFSRIKHYGGFPFQSIAFVLASQGLTLKDIDYVAVYWDPYKLGHRIRYLIESLFTTPSLFIEKLSRAASVWRGDHTSGSDAGWMSIFLTKSKLASHFKERPKKVVFLDHHAVHMASCFYGSDFEKSAILVMDGAGEASCTTIGSGSGSVINKLDEHLIPHSLGHFYSAITGYLGFKMLDGEYKLMGLSPYGDPSGVSWIRENYLKSVGAGKYFLDVKALDYHRAMRGCFKGSFEKHFGPPRELSETADFDDRHRAIAASAQRAFEEVVIDIVRDLRNKTGLNKITISGGCGLNCVANGKILHSGAFEEIYVPPVPHDAGGAIGAAMLLFAKITNQRPEPIVHAQYGPKYSNSEVEDVLKTYTDLEYLRVQEDELLIRATRLLADGKILSWMQGPMEYGPRALGNRSFLADPRSDEIREVLNSKIKKRELFRPFAPSVKEERASDYFHISQASPFMTIIVPVREEKKKEIPAVTHIDGTARPQTVSRTTNERYWKLLDSFEKQTGVPVLLNTSFNIQEPIVCTPEHALNTFGRSKVDALAIGDFWVTRK